MTRQLVIVGAGGLGRETLDIAEAADRAAPGRYRLIGVVDDGPTAAQLDRLAARDVPLLGDISSWLSDGEDADYIIAIGDPLIRARLQARFELAGMQPASLVHPSATVGSLVQMGRGVIVGSGVQISTNVELGEHVYLGAASVIGHDVRVSRFASVYAGAVLSGEVVVGESTVIGAGAVVLQGMTIGHHTVVGAAACVTHPIADGVVAKGVPAR